MLTDKEWWEDDAKKDHVRSATACSGNNPFIKLPKLPQKGEVKDKIILDIGCGYGRTLIPMAKLNPKIAYGLDISSEMLSHCAKYAKEKGVKLKLINASLPKLPFKNKSIDLIFSSSVLLHLPKTDIPTLLLEVKRVLKTNGKFYFESSFPNSLSFNGASNWFPALLKSKIFGREIIPGMPKHYTLNELRSLFSASGLKYTILPQGYQLIPTAINRLKMPLKAKINKINKLFENKYYRKYRFFDVLFPKFFDVSGTKI